ncbi:GAF domain-containing protein [Leptospira brenneri]|uniref:GAF domain-containing protein n=1 Tax=Leptospira brenneri TaxID=2023182 RepID=A0A2M9XXC4_9LEPT|nr:GAF domain-containing protein [Leptospira brenneri]PJZ43970.1 hypothetical protein CH361_17635 [Leptospira brenneri]TGK95625.1 GAF domain-containing protein [Leptospira brenneri]
MLSELAPNHYFSGVALTRDLADDLHSFPSSVSSEEIWEKTVETIARIPEIIATWILEYLPDSQNFRLLALHGPSSFQIPETVSKYSLPCYHVVDSNMIFEMNLVGEDSFFSPLTQVLSEKNSIMYLGYPIRSDIGTVIGVIGMVVEDKFKHKFKNLKLIDVIADQLSQELIRFKNQNLIAETLNTAAFVKHSLAELFRLLSSTTNNLTEICRNYLQTGTKLFGLPLGLIASKIGDDWEYSLVEGNVHGIYEGQKFSHVESKFLSGSAVPSAIILKEISLASEGNVREHLLEVGVSSLMEFSLRVHNQTIAILGFYGLKNQTIQSVELFQKVFELMGIGLANQIEKHNINLLSKIVFLEKDSSNTR